MSVAIAPPTWDRLAALRAYRETAARISAWWSAADAFERPSLHRPDILAADIAIQAAFLRQDAAALARALVRYEQAITGRQ